MQLQIDESNALNSYLLKTQYDLIRSFLDQDFSYIIFPAHCFMMSFELLIHLF